MAGRPIECRTPEALERDVRTLMRLQKAILKDSSAAITRRSNVLIGELIEVLREKSREADRGFVEMFD